MKKDNYQNIMKRSRESYNERNSKTPMELCAIHHFDSHIVILWTDKDSPEALYCEECNWIIQKQFDEWNLKQTFSK